MLWPLELSEVQSEVVTGTLENLQARYERASLKPSWKSQVTRTTKNIIENRFAYEKVQSETGLPWWLIGCLHMRESSLSFAGWLANGDPLTGPTVNVPRGLRGQGNPPWQWHDAAIISLNHQNQGRKVFLKSISEALDYAEHYNGLGYRQGAGRGTTPASTSPYIWSGTTEYEKGKYVSDNKFNPNTVDQQIGVAAIFKEMESQGISLFGDDKKPETTVSWFELFRGDGQENVIIGYNGPTPIVRHDTVRIESFISFAKAYPGAATFRVAPHDKKIPEINPNPSPEPNPEPPAKVDPYIRIKKKSNSPGSNGLVPLIAEFFGPDGKKYGEVNCISGLPGAQFFKKGADSKAGSGEPLPQGIWTVGQIEFANGRDNYSGSWGSGLGPVWVGVTPDFPTSRSAIGFHRDDNAVGTLGCIGIASTEDLRTLVQLLREHDPKKLLVDWGL